MILSLIHADGRSEFFEINEFPVIVGRDPECQVCIESENISRKHLEIQKTGDQFYIRDMTISNWVSYNEKRLDKSEFIEYFVFSELFLPGDYQIKLSPNEIEEPASIDDKKGDKKNIDLYNTPLKAIDRKKVFFGEKKKLKNNKKSEKFKRKDLMSFLVIVFLFLGGYFYFKNYSDMSENEVNIEKSPSVVKKVESPVIRKKVIDKDFLNKMLSKFNKCAQASVTDICELLIPKRFGKEGVIEYQNNLFIFKDLARRTAIYRGEVNGIETRIDFSTEVGFKILAIKETLSPVNLTQLLQKKTQFLFINLYDENKQSSGIMRTYKIRVEDLKTVNLQVYRKAFEDIRIGVGADVFETYYFAIMQKIEGS